MILGNLGFILGACVVEYVVINGILDYFHEKKYGEQEREYQETMTYLKNIKKIKKGGK